MPDGGGEVEADRVQDVGWPTETLIPYGCRAAEKRRQMDMARALTRVPALTANSVQCEASGQPAEESCAAPHGTYEVWDAGPRDTRGRR